MLGLSPLIRDTSSGRIAPMTYTVPAGTMGTSLPYTFAY